jgi:predicted transcriptional regulator
MKERRNKLQTIADVLEESKRPNCRYSHIMYGANLNTKSTNKYLDILLKSRLLEKEKDGKYYDHTNKGINFLFKYYKSKKDPEILKELENMILPVEPIIIL